MISGWVTNIQRFCMHDGPGIRTTVFLKGCPLSCAWCHNPETQSADPEIIKVEGRCIQCDACIAACPKNSADVLTDVCVRCGACVEVCPTGARSWAGEKWPDKKVMEQIVRERVFYDESGGGVTFSGGEPLEQIVFLQTLLAACREKEIHTAVDTCGFAQKENIEIMAQNANLILFDLKLMDSELHAAWCGRGNESILANLQLLNTIHERIWVRIPVISGVNTDTANLEALAEFVRPLEHVEQISLLPYHVTGRVKHGRLGLTDRMQGKTAPSSEELRIISQKLKTSGKVVHIGG